MDIIDSGREAVLLFEQVGKEGVLKSIFNKEGDPLSQTLINRGNKDIDDIAKDIMAGFEEVTEKEYEEIVLAKPCPKCGKPGMKRAVNTSDGRAGVPVMPTFICGSCGEHGYRLSNSYLEEIIRERRELFSEEEQRELNANPDGFKNELKEYIIRIFASKRISCIR